MFHVKQLEAGVVVIGGGHAGIEASLAAARMGVPTTLITMDPSKSAEMSCNPSIGGVGKGQLVKELDALGGEMGKTADFTGIQFKRLNTRKGSAVQSSRCQSDKKLYAQRMQKVVAAQPRLQVVQAEVKEIRVENGTASGVVVAFPGGERQLLPAKGIVITAGTFMKGLMHCGDLKGSGGRFGENSSVGLSDSLRQLGFTIQRLKTGTPPRLIRGSIDFSKMERQPGDAHPRKFSFWESRIELPQVDCFLTYTNPQTHDAIRANLARSPLYSGQIKGVGPRYCPSIEDKVVKFPQKDRHALFFEPEALDSDWIYPNGISTSLPSDVQEAFVRTLPGCENVVFARHGYAVEYDCIDPRQLTSSLEARHLAGLFLAGQVNGTSGYEEAAIQGLVAGINAALRAKDQPPWGLSRAEAYAGVLVDDLTTQGVTEPYRMFTSRAEFRLSLREDNADLRLTPHGRMLGLIGDSEYSCFLRRQERVSKGREQLKKTILKPSARLDAKLEQIGSSPLGKAQPLGQLLKRPEVSLADIEEMVGPFLGECDSGTQETLEIEVKYEGYIELQRQEIARLKKMSGMKIPPSTDFQKIAGLSHELKEKLHARRPTTLAEATTVAGITPAALTAVLFHICHEEGPQG